MDKKALKKTIFIWIIGLVWSLSILFQIYHWFEHHNNDIVVDFNFDSVITIILTVIGLLFAFSAINIYSIFNTNIETEKRSLRELKVHYEDEFQRMQKQLSQQSELLNRQNQARIELLSDISTYKAQLVKISDDIEDTKRRINEITQLNEDISKDLVEQRLFNSIISDNVPISVRMDSVYHLYSRVDKLKEKLSNSEMRDEEEKLGLQSEIKRISSTYLEALTHYFKYKVKKECKNDQFVNVLTKLIGALSNN